MDSDVGDVSGVLWDHVKAGNAAHIAEAIRSLESGMPVVLPLEVGKKG